MDPVGAATCPRQFLCHSNFSGPPGFHRVRSTFFISVLLPPSLHCRHTASGVITCAAEARDRRGRDDAEELYARNLSSAIPRREKENESFVLLGSALLSLLLAQPLALGATLPMKTLVNGARGILPWRSGLVGAGNEREMTRECNEPSAVVTAARSYWSG